MTSKRFYIEYPIFVFDGYSIDIFETMLDFQNKIEPIDIKNNHFVIFDSQGNALKFGVTIEKQRYLYFLYLPVEKIVFQNSYPNYSQFVEKVSMVYHETFQKNVSNLSMQEMQEELIAFYGFTR